MSDNANSPCDLRVELLPPSGTSVLVPHQTKASFTAGLATSLVIGQQPAAVLGSSGKNEGEHRQPKAGNVLIPLPTEVRIASGDELVIVDGFAIATTASDVQVPDVTQPVKSDVLETSNDFFFVNGRPAIRGA